MIRIAELKLPLAEVPFETRRAAEYLRPRLRSPAGVSSFRAKETGHIAPWSSRASSVNPNVAYLAPNFEAAWKKHIDPKKLIIIRAGDFGKKE